MIQKIYEVRCDYCDAVINHYTNHRPSQSIIQTIKGVKCTATKQFCSDECYANWNHDRLERQYCNLKQRGRFRINE